MDEAHLRRQVSSAARQLWMKGLLVADGGLVSVEVHRRRYLITPPGRRRSELQESDLRMCDIAGRELGGHAEVDAEAWLPHRVAYDIALTHPSAGLNHAGHAAPGPSGGSAGTGTGNSHPAPIHATILATPPMTMALLRLRAGVNVIELAGLPPLPIAAPTDEPAIRHALEHGSLVALGRTGGVLCVAGDIWDAVNLLERLEHAAAIEVACRHEP